MVLKKAQHKNPQFETSSAYDKAIFFYQQASNAELDLPLQIEKFRIHSQNCLQILLQNLSIFESNQTRFFSFLPRFVNISRNFTIFSNLLGVFPGFYPATQNLNSTLACASVIFIVYNYMGFREHGWGYLKHFMGPIIYLAPLMIIIEVVSHLVRPASLSLRLFWNMFGDHLVLQIFSNLTPYIIPAIFIGLGVFVSFLQAFIFTILSSIYISLSTSHDH